jgi:hypothetical protein
MNSFPKRSSINRRLNKFLLTEQKKQGNIFIGITLLNVALNSVSIQTHISFLFV